LVEDGRPGIVPQLLYAERDLLLVVIDAEDDGFDVVALLVQVGRVVHLRRPRNVALVHHSVDAFLDTDEDAVIGDAPYATADLRARRILLGEERPGIGLELLEAERDALALGVHFEHLAV